MAISRSPPFRQLVRSDDGLRVALVAERKGWVFPCFAVDAVIQHTVEEALMARVDAVKARQAEEAANERAVADAQERIKLEMQQMPDGGA